MNVVRLSPRNSHREVTGHVSEANVPEESGHGLAYPRESCVRLRSPPSPRSVRHASPIPPGRQTNTGDPAGKEDRFDWPAAKNCFEAVPARCPQASGACPATQNSSDGSLNSGQLQSRRMLAANELDGLADRFLRLTRSSPLSGMRPDPASRDSPHFL